MTLKNIPIHLHARLKESAEKNRRSLNSEILTRLERDVAAPKVDRGKLARELKAFTRILSIADQALAECEHIIPDDVVLEVVAGSTLTAYDAEFVALATALSVPLVTGDKSVLKAFPDRTLTMEAFLKSQQVPH